MALAPPRYLPPETLRRIEDGIITNKDFFVDDCVQLKFDVPGDCCICREPFKLPPDDTSEHSEGLWPIVNTKCPHVFHAICMSQLLIRKDVAYSSCCPLCRTMWCDTQAEQDEAEDIERALRIMPNLAAKFSATELPIVILSSDLIFSITVAAYAMLRSEHAGWTPTKIASDETRAVVYSMAAAAAKEEGKQKNLSVLQDQLTSRTFRQMRSNGRHHCSDEMWDYAYLVAGEAVTHYAWTHRMESVD